MNDQELLSIRQQILETSLPLLLDSNSAPEEKFDLLLRFMSLNAASKTSSLYKKAYETALSFQDSGERLDALLRLLSEVDAEIDNRPEAMAIVEQPVTEEPVSQNEETATVVQDGEQQPVPQQQQEHVDN
jgi:hypothetical protein